LQVAEFNGYSQVIFRQKAQFPEKSLLFSLLAGNLSPERFNPHCVVSQKALSRRSSVVSKARERRSQRLAQFMAMSD